MPSTFVHGLVPSSCAFITKPRLKNDSFRERFIFFFVCSVLGNLPDLDVIPGTLMKEHWFEIHRYWGHNMFSLAVWIVLGAWALNKFVGGEMVGRKAWVVSALLVMSHVLFDSMGDYTTNGVRIGVPLLWPFSKWEFLFPIGIFKSYEIDYSKNVLAAHLTSYGYWSHAVFSEIVAGLGLFLVWVLVWRTRTIAHKVVATIRVKSANRLRRTH